MNYENCRTVHFEGNGYAIMESRVKGEAYLLLSGSIVDLDELCISLCAASHFIDEPSQIEKISAPCEYFSYNDYKKNGDKIFDSLYDEFLPYADEVKKAAFLFVHFLEEKYPDITKDAKKKSHEAKDR